MKTTCSRGHLLSPDNSYTNTRGVTVCRRCAASNQQRYYGVGAEGAACLEYDPSTLAPLRRAANLTQAQIAAALNVKPDLVRQWEKGERTPTAPNILRYLIACKASPRDACRRKEKKDKAG